MNAQYEWPRKYVTKTLPSALSTAPNTWQQCNVLKVAVCFLRGKVYSHHATAQKQWHEWTDEVRLCDWGLFAHCRRNNQTQRSNFIKSYLNRQDAIAFDYCAMHVWFNKLECSDFFGISMWTTYQLRRNKFPTKSAQSLYYSILANFDALVRTHLELVLCNSYVIIQIEVTRPLLCIHVDDISTPTSGMSSVVRLTLRYSVTAKSKNASPGHI